MKHQTVDQARKVAVVLGQPTLPSMTRSQRLERWADLLERRPGAVRLFRGTEYATSTEWLHMREDGSPISIAFGDPVLREEGLAGDSYGHALQFFGLGNAGLHEIVCHCHYASHANAACADVAARVRRIAAGARRTEHVGQVIRGIGSRITGAVARAFG